MLAKSFKYFSFPVFSVVLFGCAARGGNELSELSKFDRLVLDKCASDFRVYPAYINCVRGGNVRRSSDSARRQARQHWLDIVRHGTVNEQLYAAVISGDTAAVKKALDNGGDPNHQFKAGELGIGVSTNAVYSYGKNLDVLDMLLAAGGDVALIPDGENETIISRYFLNTSSEVGGSQGVRYPVGLKAAEISLRYGYRPNASDLAVFKHATLPGVDVGEFKQDYTDFYNRVSAKVSPQDMARMESMLQLLRERQTGEESKARAAERNADLIRRDELRYDLKQKLMQVGRRGTQICHPASVYTAGAVLVGYALGVSDLQVQIQLINAYLPNNPGVKLSWFKPQIIWDGPYEWQKC